MCLSEIHPEINEFCAINGKRAKTDDSLIVFLFFILNPEGLFLFHYTISQKHHNTLTMLFYQLDVFCAMFFLFIVGH